MGRLLMSITTPPRCISVGSAQEQTHRIGFLLSCLGDTIQQSEGSSEQDFFNWMEKLITELDIRAEDEPWFRQHFRHVLHTAGLG